MGITTMADTSEWRFPPERQEKNRLNAALTRPSTISQLSLREPFQNLLFRQRK